MTDSHDQIFRAVFSNSPVGLIIVNKDTTLRDANTYMFSTFNLEKTDISNQRFGNVFHCIAVSAGENCGETEACRTCGLRGGVLAVLEEGADIPVTIIDHNFSVMGEVEKKWFKISASRIVHDDDIFAIVSFSDITTQKDYEALLRYQLSLDMATGITNKMTLLNLLKSFKASYDSITVSIIDFDDFKSINERYGRVTGDRVLSIFYALTSNSSRRQDILGRYGGQEFMLIIPGEPAALMITLLRKIAEELREQCITELAFAPSFSAGVFEFTSTQLEERSVSEIIATVDTNLYEAKKRGKKMMVIDDVGIPL